MEICENHPKLRNRCAHSRAAAARRHHIRPCLPPRLLKLKQQQRKQGLLRQIPKHGVEIRQVWSHNLEVEFLNILSVMRRGYNVVALDTEFPGTPFLPPGVDPDYRRRSVPEHYEVLRANVDRTKIIQAGVTLTDEFGNVAELGNMRIVWEFNFSDFDIDLDEHSAESVDLLARQGIDFRLLKTHGIDSARFGHMMLATGLVGRSRAWVTFQGGVDLAYLLKMVMKCPMPGEVGHFMGWVQYYFGRNVFDVKHIMTHCCGLYGGLERVAEMVKVEREAGESHRAGSDSLLIAMVFKRVVEVYFGGPEVLRFRGKLHNYVQ
uniref:poly(A)-specific ribonuclease n=1 Tax=Kalanchoe fedtschenkoi TaxID=63787 RepID=A0A7N0UTU9_KALFE